MQLNEHSKTRLANMLRAKFQRSVKPELLAKIDNETLVERFLEDAQTRLEVFVASQAKKARLRKGNGFSI